MESHLNDEQIEELLRRPRELEGVEQTAHSGGDAKLAHLNGCQYCLSRLAAQEAAMQLLDSLKPDAIQESDLLCPRESVWIEIGAGIETPDFDRYLDHAVTCRHCGELLRQAANDLQDRTTEQEEAAIAELASSAIGWQAELAAKLREGIAIPQRPVAAERPEPSFFQWIFAPSRLAFAGVFLALIALGVLDFSRSERFAQQARQAAADIDRMQTDIRQQQRITELNAQLEKNDTGAAPSRTQSTAEDLQIASLTLEPGLTRGPGEMKRLLLPPGAEIVRVSVSLPDRTQGSVHAELLTVDRQTLWTEEIRLPGNAIASGKLTLLLPASLLTPNDYLIELSRRTPTGLEAFATYSFRVPRK